MNFLNAFYRLDDDRPPAELEDVERRPAAYLDHLRRRLETARDFHDRDFYDFHLRIRTSRGWRNLDPSDEPFASNEWRTLRALLTRLDMRVFDPHEPVLPPPGPWEQRYNLAWGVESPGVLRIRRRVLESADPDVAQLFRLMIRDRTPETAIPETLKLEGRRLDAAVREELDDYPLRALALEARDLLERLLLLNHFIFFKTIDAVMARFTVLHPYDVCLSHLAPETVQSLDRIELRDRIRAAHPDFDFHATLRDHPIAQRTPRPAPPAQFSAATVPPHVPAITVGGLTFTAKDTPERLKLVLSFIRCHLHFHRFEIVGDLSALDPQAAVEALVEIDELAGTWVTRKAAPVDASRFWVKEVWKKGGGAARATTSMDSFRYALYHPPYGGASDREIELFEPEIFEALFGPGHDPSHVDVWSVDPKGSDYFIKEWWDYCWVLFNARRREAIVVFGTATD